MARRLFTLLSALSLLLCATMTVLWVRTHRVADTYEWRHEVVGGESSTITKRSAWLVITCRGQLLVSRYAVSEPFAFTHDLGTHTTHETSPPDLDLVDSLRTEGDSGGSLWTRGGFAVLVAPDVHGRARAAVVPLWSACLASGLMPLWWFTRRLRLHRHPHTTQRLCPQCGYDLRATPGRCPECGTLPAGKQA